MSTVHDDKKCFTLIELLVVIAIGAMLTLLAVPAFRSMASADATGNCAAALKNALERARVRAVNERCYVAVILPDGAVSDELKPYRLGGSRLAYVEKTVAGEFVFSRWLDPTWRQRPAGALLSQVGSAAFVPDASGDMTGCTAGIADALVGAAVCLDAVSEVKSDDGTTALDPGAHCALVFTPQGGVSGSGKCYLLISGARVADDGAIVYPVAVVPGTGRSSDNIVLKLNRLTGIVEYDK